jgi:UDP-N-acetyl-D-mannosaminuronic acid dehydrogenase
VSRGLFLNLVILWHNWDALQQFNRVNSTGLAPKLEGVLMNFDKICVLGLGYTGLPTASTFATHGVKVVGVDTNPVVVNTLRNGGLHIFEPGLRTLVQAAIGSGNLTIAEIPEPADAFLIEVPTPFYEDKRADMRAVVLATEAIIPHLRRGNLVVLESTSPPMTTINLLAPILERCGLRAGVDFHLAYSPERVMPGQILRELIENDRVIGGINRASAEAGRDLYTLFVRGEIVLTDCTTAEMVKLMENTYRDVNIALANEFSRLAERFGINVWEAIPIANRHPRVKILRPGAGVGGHCISVDPWFLVESAPDLANLIRTARQVNDSQPEHVLELIRSAAASDAADPLFGKRITVLGLAYKEDVDDLRESPAIEVTKLLCQAGAVVTAYEPNRLDARLQGVHMAASLEQALANAEVVVLLVGHTPFKSLHAGDMINLSSARVLVDCANTWSALAWEQSGFKIVRLGVNRLSAEDAPHA